MRSKADETIVIVETLISPLQTCSLLLHDSVMPSWYCLMAIIIRYVFPLSVFFEWVIFYGPCFTLFFCLLLESETGGRTV